VPLQISGEKRRRKTIVTYGVCETSGPTTGASSEARRFGRGRTASSCPRGRDGPVWPQCLTGRYAALRNGTTRLGTRFPAGVYHSRTGKEAAAPPEGWDGRLREATRSLRGARGPRLWNALLDGDRRAGLLQGLLGLVRGLLVDLLQQRLRRAVHQVLGLLEAEARQRADPL